MKKKTSVRNKKKHIDIFSRSAKFPKMGMHLSSIVAAAASCVGACAIASARISNGWKNLPTLALGYAAAAGFLVALAATPPLANRGSAALLGKRGQGSFPLVHLAAFAPFHLGLRAKLAFQRATGTESAWDEVMPLPRRERAERGGRGGRNNASSRGGGGGGGRRRRRQQDNDGGGDGGGAKVPLPYFLGGWPHEVDALPPGVTDVVDVTAELPRIALRSAAAPSTPSTSLPSPSKSSSAAAVARYLSIPTWDTHGPSPEQIERGVRWISEARREAEEGEAGGGSGGGGEAGGGRRKVLVHCAHGHGRSVTVLAAALLAERQEEEEEDEEEENEEGEESSSSCPSPTDYGDGDRDVDEVLRHIQKFRPRAKLNSRQRGALRAWLRTREEKKKQRKKTVK